MAVEKGTHLKELVSALVLFALSLLLAWYFKWEAKDVIWSIWLSSLITGILIILVSFVKQLTGIGKKNDFREKWKQSGLPLKVVISIVSVIIIAITIVLPCAFILFHFSAFHIGHAFFLNHFFPLFDVETTPFPPIWTEFTTIYLPAFKEYLLFVPIALWMTRRAFTVPNPSPVAPYKNVVLMHFFIIFFGFLFMTGLSGFGAYALVYTIFLFPWRLLRKPKNEDKTKQRVRAQRVKN